MFMRQDFPAIFRYEIISYDTYKVRARAIDAQKTTG